MKRISVVGLAFVAISSFSAINTQSASAVCAEASEQITANYDKRTPDRFLRGVCEEKLAVGAPQAKYVKISLSKFLEKGVDCAKVEELQTGDYTDESCAKKVEVGKGEYTKIKDPQPEVGFLGTEAKAEFTATSGASTLETKSKKAITCTADASKGTIENNKGTVTVEFTGCKEGKVTCSTAGDAKEVILLSEAKLALVSTVNAAKEQRAGIAVTLAKNLAITCALVKIEVRGSVIGAITPLNEEITEGKLVFEQKEGSQTKIAYSECDKGEGVCKEVKEKPLESNLSGKFEPAGEATSETLAFKQMVEFHA